MCDETVWIFSDSSFWNKKEFDDIEAPETWKKIGLFIKKHL